MKHKDKIGILISNDNVNKLIVKKEGEEWKLAELTDNQIFESIIIKNKPNIDELNRYIGFIIEFKNSYSIFKVKDLQDKRSKGARCAQAGKSSTIKQINNILDKEMLTQDNTKKMIQLELCVLNEMILRLKNLVKGDSKIWFLNNIESNQIQIEKISI